MSVLGEIFGGGGGDKGEGGKGGGGLDEIGSLVGMLAGGPLGGLGGSLIGRLLGGGGGGGGSGAVTNLAPGMNIPGLSDPRALRDVVGEALRMAGVDPAAMAAQQQTTTAVQGAVSPQLAEIQRQMVEREQREAATAQHRMMEESDARFRDVTQRLDWIASRLQTTAGPQRW